MAITLPRSGVSYSPELEAELARQWNHIGPYDWEALDGDQQARYIAVYRVHFQIEGVVVKAQADAARRQAPGRRR